ncbi:hypothetical protein ALC60_04355 [Trachymyrmex zeteki]|uniref:Uncharacterized protein n=1 Tax=Mycetomoellerius zeteki TaxID=64791 RepID=A0A151X8Q0_9HYME|nr:hypothetical protein ALC60_04355 [Trachymyrmex zeteki]
MADEMGYANGKHDEGERREKITERPVEALTTRGWHCSRCRRTSRIAFVQYGEDTRQFSRTSALATTVKTHKKRKEKKGEELEHYFEMRNLENIFNLREADLHLVSGNSECSGEKITAKRIYMGSLWTKGILPSSCGHVPEDRTKLGLSSRQGRLLQYARIRKCTERKKESENKIGFSQWGPARLRPLSGAFIVGLAFNEQAERQIKAAVISRNPRLAGYPGAGVI